MARAPLVTTVTDPQTIYDPAPATITASGDSGALDLRNVSAVLVSASVAGVTGTSPSLTLFFDVQDAIGNWLQVATIGSALTAPGYTYGQAGPVAGSGYVLTGVGRVRWTVTGTTPSFTGVQFSVIGR